MSTEPLELPLIFSASAFCLAAVAMYLSRRRLLSMGRQKGAGPPVERDAFFSAAYVDPTRFRANASGALAIMLMFALIAAVALGAVYYASGHPIIVVFAAMVGYVVLGRFDSFEALFYARFLKSATSDQLGTKDFELIEVESSELGRGVVAFAAVGLAALVLSIVADQVVTASEVGVEYYVRFLYGASQLVAPFSHPLSVALIPILFVGSLVLGLYALSRVRTTVSHHLRKV